jgi:ribosomal protein S18 acetylase RimI-like enzyme
MEKIDIHSASEHERDMASQLLASSEPWITLKITREQCEKNCHDPGFLLFMAYVGDKPGGIILIDPRGVAGSPYIKSIAVFPQFRSKGIGTKLLAFTEDLVKSKSRHIFICVSSFNNKARKLYERCGYQSLCEFKDYIIEGASEILMHKGI